MRELDTMISLINSFGFKSDDIAHSFTETDTNSTFNSKHYLHHKSVLP